MEDRSLKWKPERKQGAFSVILVPSPVTILKRSYVQQIWIQNVDIWLIIAKLAGKTACVSLMHYLINR